MAKGTQVRVRKLDGEYCKLLAVQGETAGSGLVAEENGELPGYVAFKYLKVHKDPRATDQVVVLEQGIPIKAGELIGHPGIYQNLNGAAQPVVHLELFSCDDVPGFISRSRAWASQLPDSQKTLLKVHKGASKLIAHREDINANNPPKLSDSGSLIGVDLIIPQPLLDGLPAASKIQVGIPVPGSSPPTTTYWWRLNGLFADESGNPIDGWLAEQDLITSRHSPWEWLDFQCVEDTGTPLEKLAYSFNAQGRLDAEEQHNYRAQISKADGGPLMTLARLYDMVDSDGDGVLTGREMRAALEKPWQAQMLGQLITRYESEWFWNKAKWDELDPLLVEEDGQQSLGWEVEKRRIEKLSWWGDLAGKHGIGEEARAWHFQAAALVGTFSSKKVNITIEMLKKVFEGLQGTDEADGLLGEMASQINENFEKYKLDTVLRLSHFFAQVRQEIGPKCRVVEDFTYSPEGLKATFRYFRLNPEEASFYGYGMGSKFVSVESQVAIASRAYANRYGNGDIASGDGWRYRGRGLKHLTFKSNYSGFQRYHKRFWGEDVDFMQNPDLLHENNKYVVRSGIYFWMSNNLFVEADKGSGGSVVDAITRIINQATDSYGMRRDHFKRIFEVEEIFKNV